MRKPSLANSNQTSTQPTDKQAKNLIMLNTLVPEALKHIVSILHNKRDL
jgi:hypothetical protein